MLKKILNKILKQESEEDIYSSQSSSNQIKLKQKDISSNIEKSLSTFKSIYSYPDNKDVTIRNLHISGTNKKAAVLFINTITRSQVIEDHILSPLLLNDNKSKKVTDMISGQSITTKKNIKDILIEVNNGNAVLFVDGSPTAYSISAADFKERSIEKPENEIVIKGSKEAFTEGAQTNISIIRRGIKDENLVIESVVVSERSKNEVFIIYVKDVANSKTVTDIKGKLASFDVNAIQNLPILEQYLEEKPLSPFPTILYTERPDRACSFLEDGYIVLLMDSSPASLILPATFWSFFHSAEDSYVRFLDGNFTRLLRMIALFITLFVSALYIGVTEFHTELIPADLLLAIAATREKVPFTPIFEILLMELSFELIREAGLRVPIPIGPTIGIVGALILGQAAVEANIVSPVVVIVVALGGLSSFAIGNISLNFAARLIRFSLIISASLLGIYGIMAVFTIGALYLVSLKSFGVPYLAPVTPHYKSSKDTSFRRLLKNEVFRPGYLNPKDMTKK